MGASIFKDYIEKNIVPVADKITEKINGKTGEVKFYYKNYLKPELSVNMKWSSLSTDNRTVVADVVDLESALPLKSRGSYSSLTGDIPKIGLQKNKNAAQLQELIILKNTGKNERFIVTKLFQDLADGVISVHDRLDFMFLQALSSGVTSVEDAKNNTGQSIRLDFQIPDTNRFGATTAAWGKPTATPIDDIEVVKTQARKKGHILKYLILDTALFSKLRVNDQFKKSYAGSLNVQSTQVFRVGKEQAMEHLQNEFGLTVVIIDKTVQVERNGTKTTVEPWEQGNATFTTTLDLGRLVYSELAEVDHPVEGVQYAIIDRFILGSMWRHGKPAKESTSVEALAVPVLENTDAIYILDTDELEVAAAGEVEGDTNFTIYGKARTKSTVIAAYNKLSVEDVATTITDAALLKAINSLSKANEAALKSELGI